MKKLKVASLAVLMSFAFACSSEDDDNNEGGLSNDPVSGTVYDENFEISPIGGKASNILLNEVESVSIYLTSEDLGCGAPNGTEYHVTITAPRAIGTHTTGVSATFRDPSNTDFVSTTNVTVEIISVGTTVEGKVMAESLSEGNDINGKFEVPYCI